MDIGKIENAHANKASETGFQYEPFGSIPVVVTLGPRLP